MEIRQGMTRRRGLIRRGLQAAGGALGLGLLGRAAESPAAAAPVAPSVAEATTLTLRGRGWRLVSRDFRPGQYPSAGDRATIFGELVGEADGEKVGEFYATSFYVDARFGDGPNAADSHQIHTLNLPDGTLSGVGTATFGPSPDTFAIVGGTGRYLGARGSYTVSQSPYETGGDGTAEFVLTLQP